MDRDYPLTVWGEHRFWLDILTDHARFILERLPAEEKDSLRETRRYAEALRLLRGELEALSPQRAPSAPEWIAFAKEAHALAAGYYQHEGRLLGLKLSGSTGLTLPAAFLNGTLNENQEYLRLLRYYVQGADAPVLSLWNLMDLWLDDQLSHAKLLLELLPLSETPLRLAAAAAAEQFGVALLRNKSIQGYLRFTPPGFTEQLDAADEAADLVRRFRSRLLAELGRGHGKSATAEDGFLQRFLRHQTEEAAYFLQKLSPWLREQALSAAE